MRGHKRHRNHETRRPRRSTTRKLARPSTATTSSQNTTRGARSSVRIFAETLAGIIILTAAVVGIHYIIEAKHARERAAMVTR